MEPVMNDGKLQTISHMKNSINHNRDEKIHNWDKSHQSNRFKSRRRSRPGGPTGITTVITISGSTGTINRSVDYKLVLICYFFQKLKT